MPIDIYKKKTNSNQFDIQNQLSIDLVHLIAQRGYRYTFKNTMTRTDIFHTDDNSAKARRIRPRQVFTIRHLFT